MTRWAGNIRQIGLIVRDAEAEARHWVETVGVGPFVFFRNMAFDTDYTYRGQSVEPPTVTIAVGHSGLLQVEIIQQHNDAPSAYLEFLASGREGLQHVSTWCETSVEYDASRARLMAEGHVIVHEGRAAGSDVRFVYFEGPGRGWPLIELSEALLPSIRPLAKALTAWNKDWDGTEPFLELADVAERIWGAGPA